MVAWLNAQGASVIEIDTDGIYFHPPAGAKPDLMQAALSENSAHRAKLQNYLVELVTTKQDELRVANDEAQSCRAAALNPSASKRPAANTKKP